MKLVWSPETASKAYIDTVKSCENSRSPGAAELVAAMAAGWNAKLIVETWSEGESIGISIGLNMARRHTSARHICITPNSQSQSAYLEAIQQSSSSSSSSSNSPPEMIIAEEPEKVMQKLQGIGFLVVDWRQKDFTTALLRNAAFSGRGAVVICKNGYSRSALGFDWRNGFADRKVVRKVTLPVAGGLDVTHVAARGSGKSGDKKRRWIKHVDVRSGEEHVIRM